MDEIAILNELVGGRNWRLENLYIVLDEDGATVPYEARPEQLEFRRNARNLNFIPKARKLGMSTEVVLENLDDCLFNANFRAAIVDKGQEDAWDKLQIARFAWEQGPKHPDERIASIWAEMHAACPLVSDSNGEMAWSNGSRFEAATSFTGSTLNSLHVSELGPIAAQKPARGLEIRRGTMNAVPPSGRITVETTMEGGRTGVCYELFTQAKASAKKDDGERTHMDWVLHYFSWLGHPSYKIPGKRPTLGKTVEYFAEISAKYGDWLEQTYGYRAVPLDRQAWWEAKKATVRDEMPQQFPTVVDECDMAVTVGAIYPEMNSVRSRKQVCRFEPEKGMPFYTSWDLGSSDNMAGWLIQPAGKAHNFLDAVIGEGQGAAGVAEVIRAWERIYGPIAMHLIPHDAQIHDKGSGKTYAAQLIEAGVSARLIRVVPRIRDIWLGINEVRKILPNAWFHIRTDEPIPGYDGNDTPSAVGRLESYRKDVKTGTTMLLAVPVHDECSHISDAIRTWAEGWSQGLVHPNIPREHDQHGFPLQQVPMRARMGLR